MVAAAAQADDAAEQLVGDARAGVLPVDDFVKRFLEAKTVPAFCGLRKRLSSCLSVFSLSYVQLYHARKNKADQLAVVH